MKKQRGFTLIELVTTIMELSAVVVIGYVVFHFVRKWW